MTEPGQPPRRRTAKLPTFHQPPPTPDPDPTPDLPPGPDRILYPPGGVFSDGETGDVPRDLPIPRLGRGPRTGTSGTTTDDEDQGAELDPKLVVGLVAALLGIGLSIAAVLVKRGRRDRELRKPSKRQIRAFAKPVGEILTRHAEIVHLSKDLVNGIEAAAVVGEWIEDGPLVVPTIPENLPVPTPEGEDYS